MNLLLVIFIFVQEFVINSIQFGYSTTDQLHWKSEYGACNGSIQSPIMINSAEVVLLGIPALEMIGYHNFLPFRLELLNNGHTVALTIDSDNNIPENDFEMPYIFGAMLDSEYQFIGLHFHWGAKNNRGSEHIINDIQYPLELHMVHRNKKYGNLEEALQKKDGLAVVAVFFQLREKKYKHMDTIVDHFPAIANYNSSVKLQRSLKLVSFVPVDTDMFYTYKGSLTTPPCSEIVTWIIFQEPVWISFDQMNMFRKLKDYDDVMLADNYRYNQVVGKRNIILRNPAWKITNHFYDSEYLDFLWFN